DDDPRVATSASAPPLLVTRCSADDRFVFANRACAAFLGRSPEEIVGRRIADILGADAMAAIAPHIERVLRGEEVDFEMEIPYAHTGRRLMHALYTPDRDDRGGVIGWVATVVDVTQQRHAEEARRESERRFQELADAAPVMIWISDTDKLCTW